VRIERQAPPASGLCGLFALAASFSNVVGGILAAGYLNTSLRFPSKACLGGFFFYAPFGQRLHRASHGEQRHHRRNKKKLAHCHLLRLGGLIELNKYNTEDCSASQAVKLNSKMPGSRRTVAR
jgi:hypothetical protein